MEHLETVSVKSVFIKTPSRKPLQGGGRVFVREGTEHKTMIPLYTEYKLLWPRLPTPECMHVQISLFRCVYTCEWMCVSPSVR